MEKKETFDGAKFLKRIFENDLLFEAEINDKLWQDILIASESCTPAASLPKSILSSLDIDTKLESQKIVRKKKLLKGNISIINLLQEILNSSEYSPDEYAKMIGIDPQFFKSLLIEDSAKSSMIKQDYRQDIVALMKYLKIRLVEWASMYSYLIRGNDLKLNTVNLESIVLGSGDFDRILMKKEENPMAFIREELYKQELDYLL